MGSRGLEYKGGLKSVWENTHENDCIQFVDYTHINIANQVPAYSTIDHFVGNPIIIQAVTEAGVLHSGENQSNHSAIFTRLDVGHFNNDIEIIKSEKKVNWSKATDHAIESYKVNLAGQLNSLGVPECLSCQVLKLGTGILNQCFLKSQFYSEHIFFILAFSIL